MAALELEPRILEIGRALEAAYPSRARRPLKAVDERALQLAAADRELKAALFRFVDVTPACRSLDDLARHLTHFLAEVEEPPPSLAVAMRMAGTKAGRAALGAAAAAGVRHMAHRFIAGESPHAARGELRALWARGIATSVDLLGEATVTADEADRYAARCDDALAELAALAAESDAPAADANLSVKVSALTPLMRPEAPEVGRDDAAARLRPLLRSARERGAHLHIDMESLDSLETTLELVLDLLAEQEFAGGPSAGIVLQAYLRDSPAQLERVLDWARATPRTPPLVVRLVKGAYWDHEVAEARQRGWAPPVFEDKAACDRNFEALSRSLIDAAPLVRVAIASHNLRSVSHALAYAEHRLSPAEVSAQLRSCADTCEKETSNRARGGGAPPPLEFQVLRGLGDDLAAALAASGHAVRMYCPVGDLVAGMAYLVRRLLENTANESFLGAQARGAGVEELLAPP